MKKGFTLIELLIVIAIIAILVTVVFVALDPLTRFQKARDAQRWSDVDAIGAAAKLFQVDNGGSYFTALENVSPNVYYQIGTASNGCNNCVAKVTATSCFDFTPLVDEKKLPKIPTDPIDGEVGATGYYFVKNSEDSLTIGACDPEDATSIEITR
jgi:prepilin-type N-terminal cleavage/methylation domain-containing protein